MKIKDLSKVKIGRLQPLKIDIEKSTKKCKWWICRCDCGNIKSIPRTSLSGNKVLSCGCLHKENHFKGYKEISGSYWTRLKLSAKKRNILFNITIEEAWDLFIKQNRKCAISGKELKLVRNYTHEYNNQNASIDRKDPKKEYNIDNIQWVDVDINFCKQSFNHKDFIKLCYDIVDYQNQINNRG